MSRQYVSSAHVIIICLPGRWRFQQSSFGFGLVHMCSQQSCNGLGNLILHSKDILKLTIVSLSPSVRACRSIDELPRYANAVACPTDASFQDVTDAELLPDLP